MTEKKQIYIINFMYLISYFKFDFNMYTIMIKLYNTEYYLSIGHVRC